MLVPFQGFWFCVIAAYHLSLKESWTAAAFLLISVAGVVLAGLIRARGWPTPLFAVAPTVLLVVSIAESRVIDVGDDGYGVLVAGMNLTLTAVIVLSASTEPPWSRARMALVGIGLPSLTIALLAPSWLGPRERAIVIAYPIVAGISALVIASELRQSARRADVALERAMRAEQARVAADTRRRRRAVLSRRLHDTVINTLAAVARGDVDGSLVAAQCAADLADPPFSERESGAGDTALETVVDDLADYARGLGLVVTSTPPQEFPLVILPASTASALIGATRELVRNVRRHSGDLQVSFEAASLPADSVSVTVIDQGVGTIPEADMWRGLRISVADRLAEVGGSLTVVAEPGCGVRAVATVPIATGFHSPATISRSSDPRSVEGLRVGRATVAQSAAVFIVLWIMIIALYRDQYPNLFLPISAAMSSTGLVLATVAVARNTRLRWTWSLLLVAGGLWALWGALPVPDSCAVTCYPWFGSDAAITTFLALALLAPVRHLVLGLLGYVVGMVILAPTLIGVGATLTGLIVVALLIVTLSVALQRFSKGMERQEEVTREALDREAAQVQKAAAISAASEVVDAQIRKAYDEAVPLLSELAADGDLAAHREIRRTAAVHEARIRTLMIASDELSDFREPLLRAIDTGAVCGRLPKVRVSAAARNHSHAELPDIAFGPEIVRPLGDILVNLVERSGDTVSIGVTRTERETVRVTIVASGFTPGTATAAVTAAFESPEGDLRSRGLVVSETWVEDEVLIEVVCSGGQKWQVG